MRSDKVVKIIYGSLIIKSALNICRNCNYLHKVAYIRVKTKQKKKKKKKKRNGVSAKTAIIQVVKEWKV